MNPALNQLDSPTEADQLQMLLEMKTKECEAMFGKMHEFAILERRYKADIRTGQENLNYAIEENEKIREELERVKSQLEGCKEQTMCLRCSEQQLQSEKILCRGAVDRCINSDTVNEQGDSLRDMEKQIETLTLDKKQLMTHVHWLAHELRNKDDRLKDITQMVSHYSADATTEDVTRSMQASKWLQKESSSLEEGTRKLSCIPTLEYETVDVGVQTDNEIQNGNEEVFKDRVNKLKISMLTLRAALRDNVSLADSIQQSAVQGVRHPFEPRLYSEMSSIDVSSLNRCSGDNKKFTSNTRNPQFTRHCRQGPSRQSSFPRGVDDMDGECLSPSVYHSAVASPQYGTDDESELCLLKGSRLAPRRMHFDGASKGELLHANELTYNGAQMPREEQWLVYNTKNLDIHSEYHTAAPIMTSHGDYVGDSELCGYVAGRLQDPYGDLNQRGGRINHRPDISEGLHAMSLAVFPTHSDSLNAFRSNQSRDGSI